MDLEKTMQISKQAVQGKSFSPLHKLTWSMLGSTLATLLLANLLLVCTTSKGRKWVRLLHLSLELDT